MYFHFPVLLNIILFIDGQSNVNLREYFQFRSIFKNIHEITISDHNAPTFQPNKKVDEQ